MAKFSDLNLSAEALDAVKRLGFSEPTPVQQQAIPEVLKGDDVIAAASTGTGKTAAFLLPTISKLERSGKARRAPRILVVTPTRELAQQIAFTSYKICRACRLYTTVIYGGAPYNKQIRELREGTDVLIATPGRLVDLMDRRAVNLSKIEVLILDEADRMLDMGFLPDIRKIVEAIPENRQTLLFSATIDESIRGNFGELLKDPTVIQIAHKGETAKDVDQYIIPVANKEKDELLKCLLDEKGHDKVIVFARTKARAEDVLKMLKEADFDAVSIHSDKSQRERRDALNAFRKGKAGVIVATDVLARGIDVPQVDYVVNFDLPDMPEDYIHRIGRTGRAGESGFAVSFVSPNSTKVLSAIEGLVGVEIPVMRLDTFDVNEKLIKRSKKKTDARGAERARKHREKQKSASRGEDARNKRKDKRTNDDVSYDYTGWSDLRQGAKKLKDMTREERAAVESSNARGSNRARKGRSGKAVADDELLTRGDTRRGKMRPGMKSSGLRNPKGGAGRSGATRGSKQSASGDAQERKPRRGAGRVGNDRPKKSSSSRSRGNSRRGKR